MTLPRKLDDVTALQASVAILIVAIVAAIGGGVREWHARPPIPPPHQKTMRRSKARP